MSREIEILSPPEKVDMADDWYRFATKDHFWIKARLRAIMRKNYLETLRGKKLFEIGCGNGVIIYQMEETHGVVVDGCDLNMLALRQIHGNQGNLFCLNIFDRPQKLLKQYEGILLMDVIEHIDDDVEFLKKSLDYLNKDGIVIINVPALDSLFSRYDIAAGHKRRYDKAMIRRLFLTCGIDEISISYWGFTLLPIAILRKYILKLSSKEKVISTGFEPPNKAINWFLDLLLRAEELVFKSPWLGTSIVAIGQVRNPNV